MESSISNNTLNVSRTEISFSKSPSAPAKTKQGIMKDDVGESAKAYGEAGDSKTHSLDLTDLPTSKNGDGPDFLAMMDMIQKHIRELGASVAPLAAISTPTMLETGLSASTIKQAAMSINIISQQMDGIAASFGDFILFPKLPIEIRLEIWREALPGPRVIDVVYDRHEFAGQEMHILRANQSPPGMLHVCRESREETLRLYSQIGNVDPVDGLTCSYAFLDLSQDTLFVQLPASRPLPLDPELLLYEGLLTNETFNTLKYLAINGHLWIDRLYWFRFLTNFESLLELTLVIHDTQSINANHECWRMKPAQFELVEVEESQVNNHWKQDIYQAFRVLKQGYAEWQEPKVVFKTVVRGGRQCCFGEQRDEDDEDL